MGKRKLSAPKSSKLPTRFQKVDQILEDHREQEHLPPSKRTCCCCAPVERINVQPQFNALQVPKAVEVEQQPEQVALADPLGPDESPNCIEMITKLMEDLQKTKNILQSLNVPGFPPLADQVGNVFEEPEEGMEEDVEVDELPPKLVAQQPMSEILSAVGFSRAAPHQVEMEEDFEFEEPPPTLVAQEPLPEILSAVGLRRAAPHHVEMEEDFDDHPPKLVAQDDLMDDSFESWVISSDVAKKCASAVPLEYSGQMIPQLEQPIEPEMCQYLHEQPSDEDGSDEEERIPTVIPSLSPQLFADFAMAKFYRDITK